MRTEISGADVISIPDVTLGGTEEPTECSESTSAMIAPSAGTATVNYGELCDVRCIVLAPRIGTEGQSILASLPAKIWPPVEMGLS